MTELGAKGEFVRSGLEKIAPIEADILVEGGKKEIFLWDRRRWWAHGRVNGLPRPGDDATTVLTISQLIT